MHNVDDVRRREDLLAAALARFDRADLGFFPTPLHLLPNLGHRLGHPALYAKRDDLTGLGLGGNKVRSLEFLLGKALRDGADTVIAAGGLQSNLCRVTAAAAARLGLRCVLVHNDRRPGFYQGNMLLNHLSGAEQVFAGPVDEVCRAQLTDEIAGEQAAAGRRAFVVRNGASTALGALGYVQAAVELSRQARDVGIEMRHVAMVGAMGGTAAGFVLGTALLGRPFHVQVISVEYSEPVLRGLIHGLAVGALELLRQVDARLDPGDVDEAMSIHERYLGPGYGVPTELSTQALYDAARLEGLFLESVYTSKTLAGCLGLIERGEIPTGEACCFWHTGGTAALFAQAEQLQPGRDPGPPRT
ncbi:MAG: pyridoxal-phosphate dependent enzyme [Bacillota bacterium]|nr:pyridoxal-phosphate dependent enzyme [Bacillota bacterium]